VKHGLETTPDSRHERPTREKLDAGLAPYTGVWAFRVDGRLLGSNCYAPLKLSRLGLGDHSGTRLPYA
jgi:hypothetical protein